MHPDMKGKCLCGKFHSTNRLFKESIYLMKSKAYADKTYDVNDATGIAAVISRHDLYISETFLISLLIDL